MRLAHFESNVAVTPVVGQVERPTKAFRAGEEGVEWIDVNQSGTLVIVRRSRLPDLFFTAMGHGVMVGDSEAVPGNRSGNPVEERKGKR